MEGNKQKAGVTFHWSSRHDRRVASEVQPGGTAKCTDTLELLALGWLSQLPLDQIM